MQTNVLLVDDHPMFRKGLRLLLEEEADLCVVGEAEDGQTAINLVRELSPDVVVMDISMPDLDGIQATQKILADKPDTKIIALSIHSKKDFVQEMLLAGAAGYILKQSAPEEVVGGIRAVQEGEIFLSATITELVVSDYKNMLLDEPVAEEQDVETHSVPILTTKLYRPRISGSTVPRTRLFELLAAGTLKPLTLVSAPAGYGKSTLVSQWLEVIKSDYPGVWLSLDENDNDLRTFLANLVAAVHIQFPDALQESSRLLKAPNLPSHQVMAHTLINELEGVPQTFILVLDDYHHIEEPAIHDLLAEFLRYPTQTTRLVLSTRTDPPLDLLNLHAQQQITEVRADALSFTNEETMAYLKSIVSSEVNARISKSLTEKTEGWITGLRLMTLAIEDSDDLTDLSITIPGEQQTLDYLVAEALSHQPQEIQAWLLKTSILDRFCASLCKAVCSNSEEREAGILSGNSFIQWLTQHNLFVVQLDPKGKWYRYHQLFQELLQNQLGNALEADAIAALHDQASHWFVENGLIDEAIKHAMAAGDDVGAAVIIEQVRHSEHEAGRWHSVEKWLAMLPEETRIERPGLLLAEAWVAFTHFQLEHIAALIEQAEVLLDGQKAESVMLGEINYFHGNLMYWSGQGEASVRYLEEALTQIAGKEEHVDSNIELILGLARHMIGQRALAIQSLNERIQGTNPSKNFLLTYLSATLVFIHLLSGELHQAFQETQRMQTQAGKVSNFNTEAWVAYFLAYVHLQNWDLVDAIPHFEFAAGQLYAMDTEAVIDALAGLALTQQLLERETEATQTINRLYKVIQDLNVSQFLPVAQSCQARISLLRGDLKAALELEKSEFKTPHPAELFLWLEVPAIAQARVLSASGSEYSLEQADQMLQAIRHQCETHFFTNQTIEVAVLHSLTMEKQGRSAEALATLEEALALALPGRWIRPFVELGTPMKTFLRRLKLQGVTKEMERYIDQILATFPSAEIPSEQPGLLDPLTEREMEVLQLLATALSTEEIAAQLMVSIKTLRTHTRNIYSKLDVHSRIEAVQRARELGLIKVSKNE